MTSVPWIGTDGTGPRVMGVKTEEIRKGRIFPGLRDIRRVFLEIVPLHKSKEKRGQTEETPRTTQENNVFHVFFP